jgi:branched-chain amino acid transport system substrate-binding protein
MIIRCRLCPGAFWEKKGAMKMIKRGLLSCFAGLLAVVFVLLGGYTPAAAESTLKIGAIWSLSGPGSQLQVIMRDAAVLAAEWINREGGLKVGAETYKIELIVEDNKSSAEGSVSAATKLVLRDKLKFLTGMIVPFQIEAAQTITEPNGVILSVGKHSVLFPKNPYTFSSTQGFTVPIPGLYEFLVKKYPGVKTLGFIAADEPGALSVLKVARAEAEKHGLKIMEPNLAQFGTKDYYPTWSKVLKDKSDAMDIGVNFVESIATIVRHGRELGYKGPIVTVTTGGATDMVNLIGKEWTMDLIAPVFDLDNPSTPPMVKEIVTLWEGRFKEPFHISALLGWSSVWCLAQAIVNSQSLDPLQVAKAWGSMKTIETPWGTGTMGGAKTFGINHMVIPPTSISLLNAGKVELTEWHQPVLP